MRKLLGIGFIWLGCAVAWMVLAGTIVARTGELSSALGQEVHLLWGPPMRQQPPRAIYSETQPVTETVRQYAPDGRPFDTEVLKQRVVEVPVPLAASDLRVRLNLAHRRKGLLWFPTYAVDFRGRYAFANATAEPRAMEMTFPLPAREAIYDGFEVTDAAGEPVAATVEGGVARWTETLAPGERREYGVAYRSRGTSTWHYEPTAGTGQVRDFGLVIDADFHDVDFPAGTISPTRHGAAAAGGWRGAWEFRSLVAGAPIGIELPQRLNPGPLASKITFFAPVGLLFFFFVVAVLAAARRREIHPMHYFLIGCAFFGFHLLFAYLVDHLAILSAFAVASAVSIALVTSYARLFTGWRFALREMGIAQLVYLVLFSYTFFWKGFTGLAITIGAILTLFVIMQMTGRADWAAGDRGAAAPDPAPGPA